MTDSELQSFLGKPAITKLHNVNGPLMGPLNDNGDGTYSVDWGLDNRENKTVVQRFTVAEIEYITLA
jgi:hypothetical protein